MAKAQPVEVEVEVATGTTEKSPMQSKKFVGYLIFQLSMLGLAAGILAWAWNLDEISARVFFLMLTIIVVMGFVATGYILGVASLDKYLGLAQIAADGAATGRTNGSLNRVLGKGTKGMIKVDPNAMTPAPEEPELEPESEEEDEEPLEDEEELAELVGDEEDLADPDEDVDEPEDVENPKA
jgi:hypothetical protein